MKGETGFVVQTSQTENYTAGQHYQFGQNYLFNKIRMVCSLYMLCLYYCRFFNQEVFFFTALSFLLEYVQCQPAPPQVLDILPQPCNLTIECIPNLCCQEGNKKICRPPKRSFFRSAAQAIRVSYESMHFPKILLPEYILDCFLIRFFTEFYNKGMTELNS